MKHTTCIISSRHKFIACIPLLVFLILWNWRDFLKEGDVSSANVQGNKKSNTNSSSSLLSAANTKTDDEETARTGEEARPATSSTCPAVIVENMGIYHQAQSSSGSDSKSVFPNVVLVTPSNHGFLDFLENWELLAAQHGLKWVVLSLDHNLHELRLSQNKSTVLTSHETIATAVSWNSKRKYKSIVCSKPRALLELMSQCPNVDFLFSDVDVAFLKDPFRYGELGDMILRRSGPSNNHDFDYIYSTEKDGGGWTEQPRETPCISEGRYAHDGINTGFQFLRNTPAIQSLLNETVISCNSYANDQAAWAFRLTANSPPWQHCGVNQSMPPPANRTAGPVFCCMDSHYYPSGFVEPRNTTNVVTFHANFAKGTGEKIAKLKRMGAWKLPPPSSPPSSLTNHS